MAPKQDLSAFYNSVPIKRENKEIRLLKLQFIDEKSINTTEPIRCELVRVSLLNPPNFNALSYTWGAQEFPRKLLVTLPVEDLEIEAREHSVAITENLYTALIHLRTICVSQDLSLFRKTEKALSSQQQSRIPGIKGLPDVTHTSDLFWVDAVCINQRDKHEKTWQVNLMRDIYTSASQVAAWIGTSEESLRHVRELLWTLRQCVIRAWNLSGWFMTMPLSYPMVQGIPIPLDLLGTPEERALEKWFRNDFEFGKAGTKNGFRIDNDHACIALGSLRTLESLPYWNRAWTLEEVVLGRRVIFYTGSGTFHSLEVFHGLSLCGQALGLSTKTGVERGMPNQVYTLAPLSLLWKYEDQTFSRDLPALLFRINGGSISTPIQAYKPIDHIFGLLGMATDFATSQIRSDYSMSCRDVYTQAARHCIASEGLRVLSLCQWPSADHSLPSWVPDFSDTPSRTRDTRIWEVTAKVGGLNHPPFAILPYNYGEASVEYNQNELGAQWRSSFGNFRRLRIDTETLEPDEDKFALRRPAMLVDTILEVMPKIQIKQSRSWLHRIWRYQVRLQYIFQRTSKLPSMYHSGGTHRHDALAFALTCGGFDRGRTVAENLPASMANITLGFRDLIEHNPLNPAARFTANLNGRTDLARLRIINIINSVYLLNDTGPGTSYDRALTFQYKIDPWLHLAEKTMQSNSPMTGFLARYDEMHCREAHTKRRLFITEKGYVGIGPQTSLPGDVTALLHGGYTPFILRWVEDENITKKSELPTFNLVGESYVHGLMDREPRDFPAEKRPLFMRASMEARGTVDPVPSGEEMIVRIV
jgi:hypothetical protein